MYQRTELPSGIKIISEQIPMAKSVALGIWFEVGSRDENDDELGFAHFIEHLVFKGNDQYNAREIAEEVDSVGGQLNAFTTKEHTCFYTRVLDQSLPKIVDILHEMLLKAEFNSEEIDRERKVIIEEIKMCEDLPEDYLHDRFSQELWNNQPLGRSILGTEASITAAKRKNLIEFYQKNYTTDRLVIAAAGNIDHQYLVDHVARPFEQLRAKSAPNYIQTQPSEGGILHIAKDTEQVHICFGGSGLSRFDDREYAIHLLDMITGGGMSSRLFQELREQRGLVYSTYSDHSAYRREGEFVIYAGCSKQDSDEVLTVISAELNKLKTTPLIKEEFIRAQGQLKGSLALSLESTSSRMNYLAMTELNHKPLLTFDEIVREIELVTLADLYELSKEIFRIEAWNLVTIGLA